MQRLSLIELKRSTLGKSRTIYSFTISLQDILSALDRDAEWNNLDDRCDYAGSYWAGKDIGFAVRTASISRAFGTNHYVALDITIQRCLDRWLRVNGVYMWVAQSECEYLGGPELVNGEYPLVAQGEW